MASTSVGARSRQAAAFTVAPGISSECQRGSAESAAQSAPSGPPCGARVTPLAQLLILVGFVGGQSPLLDRAPLIPSWTVLTIRWGLVRIGGLARLDRMVARRWTRW